jgi:ubiquinone/menaquinone biosynthesis C-methylase UbiE
MTIIPWRVTNFLSEHFPLAYHLSVNIGFKGNTQTHWDQRLAETWDGRDWPTKSELIAELTQPKQKIVDIACGTGSILRYLKERGYSDLSGLETSRYAVDRLRSEGITMYQGRLPNLPMPDSYFDVIIASQILEHVIRRQRFMREMLRVLKPEGRALIFVPNNCLGPIDEPEHVIKYSQVTFTKFLSEFFEILSIDVMKDRNYPMTILVGHVRKPR